MDNLQPPKTGDDAVRESAGSSVRSFVLVLGALSIFFAAAAWQYFHRYPLPVRAELVLWGNLILLLFLAALPALGPARPLIRRWLAWRWAPPAVLLIWLLPYLLYAAGTGDFRWPGLSRALGVCAPPWLIYYLALRRFPRLLWSADVFAWLWFTLAVVLRQLGGIWNVPVSLDFMARLFVIAVASWCWVFVRPVPRLGYEFSLSLRAVRSAALNFACFAVIAIPAAFAMRFAAWHPRWHGAIAFCLSYVEILVFIAWLEELFFRGFLQTYLSRLLRSDARGQLVASVAFGLSHILLAPAPNWRYVALASVAGWFYGSAFRQTGNLVAPALTHALVDAVWRTWFTAG